MNGASKVSVLGRTNDKKKLIDNIDKLEKRKQANMFHGALEMCIRDRT